MKFNHGEKVMLNNSTLAQIALSFILLCSHSVSADAQNSERLTRYFGLTSLPAGQTLRFNAVNTSDTRVAARVTIRFDVYGLGGPDTSEGGLCNPAATTAACTNNLRPVRSETCVVNLTSREAASCDISSFNSATSVNTTVLIEGASASQVLSTLEVRENNRTLFIHPGLTRGFNPQPDPPTN